MGKVDWGGIGWMLATAAAGLPLIYLDIHVRWFKLLVFPIGAVFLLVWYFWDTRKRKL